MKLLLTSLGLLAAVTSVLAGDLRIGIIGCDTSHAVAFTELINNPEAKGHSSGGKVVAAFAGGSMDIPSSASRVDGYVQTLRTKFGVKMFESIAEMCNEVDAVLLESVDGRPHLDQIRPVLKASKPVFVDKPMAGSLRDVITIFELAEQAKVPVFSSSALRYGSGTQRVRAGSLGETRYAETCGPCEIEPHHPDLFWYGVHGVEALFTVLGPGCDTVERSTTPEGNIEVRGIWADGRRGVFREAKDFRGLARGEKGEAEIGSFDSYAPLVAEIMNFFQTGVAPVPPRETQEIFAFMEAADESKKRGGRPVPTRWAMDRARAHSPEKAASGFKE
jgi:hypothetical protein